MFLRLFVDILESTTDDVDAVVLEADGEWHTTDGKYRSNGWVPPKPPPEEVIDLTLEETDLAPPAGSQGNPIDLTADSELSTSPQRTEEREDCRL